MCLECLVLSKNNVMPGRRERPDDDNAGEGEGRLSGSLRSHRIYLSKRPISTTLAL